MKITEVNTIAIKLMGVPAPKGKGTVLVTPSSIFYQAQRDRLHKGGLIPELVVDGLPAHPGVRGDVGHPQRGIALFGEQVRGRVKEGLAQGGFGSLTEGGDLGHPASLTQIVNVSRQLTRLKYVYSLRGLRWPGGHNRGL